MRVDAKTRVMGVAAIAIAGLLAGCGQMVSARVVEGPAGIATVVERTDPRMGEETDGLPGAEVRILTPAGGVLASGTTDDRGRVSFTLPRNYRGRIRIEASADGYQLTRSDMYVPPESSRVLVVVPRR